MKSVNNTLKHERANITETIIREKHPALAKMLDETEIAHLLLILVDYGNIDIEMFGDACAELGRSLTSKENRSEVQYALDGVSKHTRIHLFKWLEQWRSFFKCAGIQETDLQVLCDLHRIGEYGSLTEDQFLEIENRYTSVSEVKQAA